MEHITVKEILEATGGRLLCGSADTPLDHLSIDSRTMKGNDLFVPLVGEKVDAHRFIGQAQADAAGASLTLQGCSVADSTDNLSPEARIGSEELKDWMARGVGDIRIQP